MMTVIITTIFTIKRILTLLLLLSLLSFLHADTLREPKGTLKATTTTITKNIIGNSKESSSGSHDDIEKTPLDILLQKRDLEVDEWDTQELKHLESIKRASEAGYQVKQVKQYNGESIVKGGAEKNEKYQAGPVTLNELISSGVGMLVNHRISNYRDPLIKTQKRTVDVAADVKDDDNSHNKNGENYYNMGRNEQVVMNVNNERDSSNDDNHGSFLLFLTALFPAVIGLIVLISFVVIIIVEVMKRTHPSWKRHATVQRVNYNSRAPGETNLNDDPQISIYTNEDPYDSDEGALFSSINYGSNDPSSSSYIQRAQFNDDFYGDIIKEPVIRKKIASNSNGKMIKPGKMQNKSSIGSHSKLIKNSNSNFKNYSKKIVPSSSTSLYHHGTERYHFRNAPQNSNAIQGNFVNNNHNIKKKRINPYL